MTQRSIPWNGTTVGDSGPYADSDWQLLWQNIIGWGGQRANVGPLLGSGTQPNDGLKVQAQSPLAAAVDVLAGAAMAHGIFYLSDATEALTVGANSSGNPRIDTVILRVDYTAQEVRLALLAGTAAATPAPPTLTQSSVLWEIPLADIAVANGFTTIANSVITPRHEWVNAPPGIYLDNILNNSGADLETGDVVIWDTSADRAVTTTTRANDRLTAGVWVGRTATGSRGRVLKTGIGLVKTNAAVTRGNRLGTSTTAKQAAINTLAQIGRYLAQALETTGAEGLALCYVEGQGGGSRATIADQKASGTAGGTSTATTWTTRALNTEVSDPDAIVTLSSNKFTPVAGVYKLVATAPFMGAANPNAARTRLRNVTTTTVLKTSPNVVTTNTSGGVAMIEHTFVANGTDEYDVQYYVNGGLATNGLGAPISEASVAETYLNIELELIG